MKELPSPSPNIQAFVDGSIGWLVLNRPEKRNAMTLAMWAAMPPLMKVFDERVDVKVVAIRGAGLEAFAAGADFAEFDASRGNAAAGASYDSVYTGALAAVRQAAKPTIAMISGVCIGGGVAIAMACDMRIASPSAGFILPPALLGIAYAQDGLRDLVSAIGAPLTKELILTARRVEAGEAVRIGLVNSMANDAEAEVRSLCGEIAAKAPLTVLHARRAIDMIAGRNRAITQIELDELAARCLDSEDYAEARRAFAEKRKPKFEGR